MTSITSTRSPPRGAAPLSCYRSNRRVMPARPNHQYAAASVQRAGVRDGAAAFSKGGTFAPGGTAPSAVGRKRGGGRRQRGPAARPTAWCGGEVRHGGHAIG